MDIEDLAGFPKYVEPTLEDKQVQKKRLVEEEMKIFDLLPIEVRDCINESEYPLDVKEVALIFRSYKYDIKKTVNELKSIIRMKKHGYFRTI